MATDERTPPRTASGSDTLSRLVHFSGIGSRSRELDSLNGLSGREAKPVSPVKGMN